MNLLAMDPLNKEQRRRNMQAIKNKNTSCEVILAKSLWQKGYRYRRNDKTIFGCPDIVFRKLKIVIFTDGEFWHGKNWSEKKSKISSNKEYWIKKIERNIERDKKVTEVLRLQGWTVIRFWHGEIKKFLPECLNSIEEIISQKWRE